ncbi:unnamed protein product, partial [Prorocentrum cordatum]
MGERDEARRNGRREAEAQAEHRNRKSAKVDRTECLDITIGSITGEELGKAIKKVKNGKAAVEVPAEYLKAVLEADLSREGWLLSLMRLCCETKTTPSPWHVSQDVLFADDALLISRAGKYLDDYLAAVAKCGVQYGLQMHWDKDGQIGLTQRLLASPQKRMLRDAAFHWGTLIP